MAYTIRSAFESYGLIGSIITDLTLTNVMVATSAALSGLIDSGTIQNFTGLKARQSGTNADVITISYSWLPALPLNYIVVQFTLDVTTGVTTPSAAAASAV